MPRALPPALFILPALVLLPFGRGSEYPLAVLAVLGVAVAAGGSLRLRDAPVPTALALYGVFVIPMLLALPDAVNLEKSLLTTVGSLRFGGFALGLLWLLQVAQRPGASRDTTLRLVGATSAILLTLWCLDGLLQFVSGRNVLGYGLAEGYINSVFGDGENLKFGITVALLLPLGLVHALRYWPPPATAGFLLLVLLLLILSGKRAAWIAGGVELLALGLYYLVRGKLALRGVLAVGAVLMLAATLAYSYSDWVQRRSRVLVSAVAEPDYAHINDATGRRLPIWYTAAAMARDNWLNGVGPRGFRYAYADYAAAGDRWTQPLATGGARASHAHQLLLEIASETGVIGLAGLGLFVALLLRCWRRAAEDARARAMPFGVALIGMLFPLNTHPAWYSSWASLLLWLFTGLFLYALAPVPQEDAA